MERDRSCSKLHRDRGMQREERTIQKTRTERERQIEKDREREKERECTNAT